MKAQVVAITQPLVDGINTAEEFVVWSARISNPTNRTNTETAPKFLKYLIEHHHWSPFEQVSVSVELETSRAIAAQILRHRSFTFQEFSQRYSDVDSGNLTFEHPHARRQDTKNRQASHDDLPDPVRQGFEDSMNKVWSVAKQAYDEALGMGVAKECARFLLPLATTTRMVMTGSLRSWIHYLQIRTDVSTQLEHRELAQCIQSELRPHFPHTFEALGW